VMPLLPQRELMIAAVCCPACIRVKALKLLMMPIFNRVSVDCESEDFIGYLTSYLSAHYKPQQILDEKGRSENKLTHLARRVLTLTSEMPTFAYVLRLARSGAFRQFSAKEEATIDQHFDYLKKGLAEKKLILAGPCVDGEFGLVIFRAASKEEAENFMRNDPAVKNHVMNAELHPFRVSLIEKE
jgi:uncharacterized protein YciI